MSHPRRRRTSSIRLQVDAEEVCPDVEEFGTRSEEEDATRYVRDEIQKVKTAYEQDAQEIRRVAAYAAQMPGEKPAEWKTGSVTVNLDEFCVRVETMLDRQVRKVRDNEHQQKSESRSRDAEEEKIKQKMETVGKIQEMNKGYEELINKAKSGVAVLEGPGDETKHLLSTLETKWHVIEETLENVRTGLAQKEGVVKEKTAQLAKAKKDNQAACQRLQRELADKQREWAEETEKLTQTQQSRAVVTAELTQLVESSQAELPVALPVPGSDLVKWATTTMDLCARVQADVQSQLEQVQIQNAKMDADSAALKRDLSESNDRLEARKTEIQCREQEAEVLQRRFQAEMSHLDAQISEVKKKLAETTSENARQHLVFDQQVAELRREEKNNENEILELRNQMEDVKARSEEKRAESASTCHQLQADIRSVESFIFTLKTQLESAMREVTSQKEALAAHNSAAEELQAKLNQMEEERRVAEAEMSQEAAEFDQQQQERGAQIDQLEEAIRQAEGEGFRLNEELQSEMDRRNFLTTEQEAMRQRLASEQVAGEKARLELQAARATLTQLEAELTQLTRGEDSEQDTADS